MARINLALLESVIKTLTAQGFLTSCSVAQRHRVCLPTQMKKQQLFQSHMQWKDVDKHNVMVWIKKSRKKAVLFEASYLLGDGCCCWRPIEKFGPILVGVTWPGVFRWKGVLLRPRCCNAILPIPATENTIYTGPWTDTHTPWIYIDLLPQAHTKETGSWVGDQMSQLSAECCVCIPMKRLNHLFQS